MRSFLHRIFSITFLAMGMLAGCKPTTPPPLHALVWLPPEEAESFKLRIADFCREHPHLAVEAQIVASAAECRTEFESRLRQGLPCDICLITAEDVPSWAQSGMIQSLPDTIPLQDFLPEITDAFRHNGKLYARPCGWSTLVLYYNRALFERHGIPLPRPSWDWGDLLNAAQALTVIDPETDKTLQYGLEATPSVETWLPLIWQNRGELAHKNGNWILTDPQFCQSNLEAISFYADLAREYGVTPAPVPLPSPKGKFFLAGKAAMIFAHRDFSELLLKSPWEWDIAPLPRGREPSTLLEARGYAISTSCKRVEDAQNFIAFLVGETFQTAMIQRGMYVPSRRALLTSKVFLDFPGANAIQNSVLTDSIAFSRFPPVIPNWKQAAAILTEEMSALMSDRDASARNTLERMQARLDELKWVDQTLKGGGTTPLARPLSHE